MTADGPHGSLAVLAVHLVPGLSESDLTDTLRLIRDHMTNSTDCISILIGDINAHPADEPRLILGSGKAEFSHSRYTNQFDETLRHLAEITGGYFTYKRNNC